MPKGSQKDVAASDPLSKFHAKLEGALERLKRLLQGTSVDSKVVLAAVVGDVIPGMCELAAMLGAYGGNVSAKIDDFSMRFAELEARVDDLDAPATMIVPEDAQILNDALKGSAELIAQVKATPNLSAAMAESLSALDLKVKEALVIVDESMLEDDEGEDDEDDDPTTKD